MFLIRKKIMITTKKDALQFIVLQVQEGFLFKIYNFRAPVLVAIALIEIGIEKIYTIQLIRLKRKGAINILQYKNLMSYKKNGFNGKSSNSCCMVF